MKEKQFEKEKTVCKEKVSYTKITDHSSRHFTKIYVTQITELLRFEIDVCDVLIECLNSHTFSVSKSPKMSFYCNL